jgi:hypothetical protein
MKQNPLIITVVLTLMLLVPGLANAQRRPVPQPSPSTSDSKAQIADAIRITAEQTKLLNRFIYILGGVADAIEKVDEEMRQGKASRSAIEQNDRNKDAVMQSIRNLRAGVVSLEVDFRSKEYLRPYSGFVSGITQMMGTAEDQVGDGKVREAGRTLLAISERLIDTLATLP